MNMDYYQISAEELGQNAKVPLLKLGDSGEVFYELALEMVGEIEKNNAVGRRTVFICPVGPVGQYPIFVRLVNERRLSLKNCWFINMDEYLTDDEEWIDERSPLSFHRVHEPYGLQQNRSGTGDAGESAYFPRSARSRPHREGD